MTQADMCTRIGNSHRRSPVMSLHAVEVPIEELLPKVREIGEGEAF